MKKRLEDLNCVLVDIRKDRTNDISQFRRKFMWDQVRHLSIGDAKLLVKRELEELNLGETLSDALHYLCDVNYRRKGYFPHSSNKIGNRTMLKLHLNFLIKELFKEV